MFDVYRVFEEEDSEHDERLVGNPIYSDSLPDGTGETLSEAAREKTTMCFIIMWEHQHWAWERLQ